MQKLFMTVLCVTTILITSGCGDTKKDKVTPAPKTSGPSVTQADNTYIENASSPKLETDITLSDNLEDILNGSNKTTDLNRDNDVYKYTAKTPGAYVFVRMSETGAGAGLREDLRPGQKVKIVIEAKSGRTLNMIRSQSLGIPKRFFQYEHPAEFETIQINFNVTDTYKPDNYFDFRLENKGDYVTIKSIKVYVE
ncbi:MAG: hypothetical protein L3J43_00735 [Sulfurovum sp.]|nr:hypothetical protein [Sulfurovum sp.]